MGKRGKIYKPAIKSRKFPGLLGHLAVIAILRLSIYVSRDCLYYYYHLCVCVCVCVFAGGGGIEGVGVKGESLQLHRHQSYQLLPPMPLREREEHFLFEWSKH